MSRNQFENLDVAAAVAGARQLRITCERGMGRGAGAGAGAGGCRYWNVKRGTWE